MARSSVLGSLALLALFAASCTDSDPAQSGQTEANGQTSDRPNLILISIDSLRADHLGLNGYRAAFTPEQGTSPFLDRFAQSAIVYDQAWSSSSWTLPAHASMFTGLDTYSHGVANEDYSLDPQHQTLAERLSAADYRCFGVYSGDFVGTRWGFQRGFERYESAMMPASQLEAELAQWRQRRLDNGHPEPSEAEVKELRKRATLWDVSSPRVNQRGLKILQDQSTDPSPFFLFLHYYDCHYDYVPERADPELARMFDPEYQGNLTGIDWLNNPLVRAPELPRKRRITERDLKHVEALYDTEIRWVDFNIGQILDELKRLGLDQNTVVAIVSDHGDEFFDHGSIGHRTTLYTELTKVLMMIHLPQDPRNGSRITVPASLVDLPATLLDALQMPPWPQSQGRSVLPSANSNPLKPGLEAGVGVFSHLFSYLPTGPRMMESWRGPRFTVIRPLAINPESSTEIDLIQARFPDNTPAYLVYDRQVDPGELRPIPPSSPAFAHAVDQMRAAFFLRQKQRQTLPRSAIADRKGPRLSTAEEIGLNALGYLDRPIGAPSTAKILPLGPLPVPPPAD
jgi:arylsulfatase A-like enzyme